MIFNAASRYNAGKVDWAIPAEHQNHHGACYSPLEAAPRTRSYPPRLTTAQRTRARRLSL